MPARRSRELIRWTIIALTGGAGLYVARKACFEIVHPPSDAPYKQFTVALLLPLMSGPLLLTAQACLRRDYAMVVEVWSTVVSIVAASVLMLAVYLANLPDLFRWTAETSGPADWTPVFRTLLVMAVCLVLLLGPVWLGRGVYRFCRRKGGQFLPVQPSDRLRHAG